MCFFWLIGPKNWKGWSHIIETFHKEKSGILEQKPKNENFVVADLHAQRGYHEIQPITEQHSG